MIFFLMMYKRFVALTIVLLFFGGCALFDTSVSSAPQVLVEKPKWPHEESDLAPDAQTYFGQLPNGLRYILKQNRTPRDRVSMHLYVQSGSLAESEGEAGIAHFLEHMLFDGSTHFPPGEMVKYFQRIGMQFGPDANAHTGFGQTVFDIQLPKGDAQSIAEGLLVLKDYAQGALLLPDQVEKEKKVVLAEKRSRDSVHYRTLEASLNFELSGTLAARRLPIGKEETILSFDAGMLRHFYDSWYRPERMILILVGQFDSHVVQDLIKEQFADMKPISGAEPLPSFGSFHHSGIESFYHHEKESGSTSVSIEIVEQEPSPPDTVDNQRIALLKALADRMMQKRLDAMVQEKNSALTSARVGSGYYLQQVRYAEISADCKPDNWKNALAAIEQAFRKAVVFGFTPSELERAKMAYLADLQRDVNETNTRESKDLSQSIMDSLNEWQVFQSPQQRMALLGPMLEEVTMAQVNQALDDTWAVDHRLVLVTGNVDLTSGDVPAVEQISAAYHDSRQIEVKAPVDETTAKFPYLPVPSAKGAVAKRNRLDDLGIEQVVFANGVRLIMKPTAFKENEVVASLSFGAGKSSEPVDQPGLAELTEQMANESGFGAMDRVALENALAGRLARVALDIREDMFAIRGQTATSELPLLFQLLQASLLDPGYRPEALEVAFKRLEQKYRSLSHSVEGLMQVKGQRFLAGGDNRFGWPPWQQMAQLSLEQIKQWFGRQLTHAPLELAIVGDFEPDRVIELAARYLGSLPPRSGLSNESSRTAPAFPTGDALQLSAETNIDKAFMALSYPTADFWDIRRTRRLNMLAELFSERLRVRIREKLGAAYSPYAYNRAYRAYEGYGLLQAVFLVDPKQVDAVAAETRKIAAEMAAEGISEDELRRSLDPTLAQIKDLRQSNNYWLNSVLVGSSRHPEQLEWARSIEKDYAAITIAEMSALARHYLDNSKTATIIIVPDRNSPER